MEHDMTCPPFSDALINEQLQRIFTSPSFSVSDILKRFLQYIVQETLEERSNMIKEYTIGVNVLNKPPDFKPQHDAIVRIHAGRLRRALHKYYKESGSEDLIEISIPKGSYVPAFSRKDNGIARPEIKNAGRPDESHFPLATRIVVMPFRCFEMDRRKLAFADSIGQQLSVEFGRFSDFSVVAYYATKQMERRITDIHELSSIFRAKYAITGNVQFEGKKLRVGVQLTDLADGEQIWANSFDYNYEPLSSFGVQDKIVAAVIGLLGDFYGLIMQQATREFVREKKMRASVSKAMIWYNRFHADLNNTAFDQAIQAMELAVKENPDHDLAWAYLGEFYLHADLFRHQLKDDPILLGLECAHRALRLNPRSAQGYITLAWTNIYLKNKAAAIEAIEHARSLHPNASGIMGLAACIMICAGDYEKGFKGLTKSMQLNTSYPPAFNFCMALYFIKKKNFDLALQWIEKLSYSSLIWFNMIRIVAYAGQGKHQLSTALSEMTEDQTRELAALTRETLGKFLLDADLVEQLFKGLKNAKLPLLTVA